MNLSRLKVFQEKMKKRTKMEVFKGLFQSFTMTAIVVVAAVVLIPKSPKASFDEVKAFSHEVVYSLNVTDSDNVVKEDELTVILESQTERFESVVSIGKSFGSFTGLKENTKYNLKVVYNKGFGDEVLAKEIVTTDSDLIAAITSVNKTSDSFDYLNIYDIGISYGLLEGYSDFSLKYASIYEDYPDQIFYDVLTLSGIDETVEIEFYDSGATKYHLVLEAVFDGNTVIVDEVYISPPFKFNASIFISYYNDKEAAFGVYLEGGIIDGIELYLDVYRGSNKVNEIEYIPSSEESYSSHDHLIVSGLSPETEYSFILRANYVNPDTLREESLEFEQIVITTLPKLDISFEVVEYDSYYEVFVTSKNLELDQVSYEIYYYDEVNQYWYYLESNYYILSNFDGEEYQTSFIVNKQIFDEYYVEIMIESSLDYQKSKSLIRIES
jgi:hypothetical protein